MKKNGKPYRKPSQEEVRIVGDVTTTDKSGDARNRLRATTWAILKDEDLPAGKGNWVIPDHYEGWGNYKESNSNPYSSAATSVNAANYTTHKDSRIKQAAIGRSQGCLPGLGAVAVWLDEKKTHPALMVWKLAEGEEAPPYRPRLK